MKDFISDAEMAKLETPNFISDEEMAKIETPKKPYIPTLPEKGFLKPTPLIEKPSKSLGAITSELMFPKGPFGRLGAVADLASYVTTKATGVKPTDIGREGLNIMATGEIILGTALGGSAVPYTKTWKELQESREKSRAMNDQLIKTIKSEAEQGKDVKRLRSHLAQKMLDEGAGDEEINEALKLTTKQIIGAGIQTALDVITAGRYKALAQTGKLLHSTGKILAKQTIPTLLGQFKVGLKSAGIGGLGGYAYEVSSGLQEDELDLSPGFVTLLGMGLPLAGKMGEMYGKEQRLLRKERKLGEIIENYRQVVNPLKSDIQKIEIKGGKDLDDTLRFMAEERVVPRKDSQGRLDTVGEREILEGRKKTVDTLLANSLDDTQQINNLNEVRAKAKKEIAEFENNAEILAKKEEDIDALIDAEIKRYGRSNVTDRELHDIKNGMWSVGFDMNRTTKSPSAKKVGNIARMIIEENNIGDFNIREMNKLSGNYRDAIDLLGSVHGNAVKGGKLGGFFYRMLIGFGLEKVLGSVPGLRGVSFFIGQFIGKHYNEFINDPERIISKALKEVKKIKLDKRSDRILNIFEEGLKKKRVEEWNKIINTRLLEAPKERSPEPIELPNEGVLRSQAKLRESALPTKMIKGQEAISVLLKRGEGEIPNAFNNPELGDIDLIYGEIGERGYGLAHIQEQRPSIIPKLDKIISIGKVTKKEGTRAFIETPDHKAVIVLNWMDKPKKWVLTAYENVRAKGIEPLISSLSETHSTAKLRAGKPQLSIAQKGKKVKGGERVAFGAIAGIETYKDDEGNTQVRYNPTKGALGMIGMAGVSKLKGADKESLIEQLMRKGHDKRVAGVFVEKIIDDAQMLVKEKALAAKDVGKWLQDNIRMAAKIESTETKMEGIGEILRKKYPSLNQNNLESWTKKWIDRAPDEKFEERLTPEIETELNLYRPKKSVRLYRGVTNEAGKDKQLFSSWTYNKEVAKMHTYDKGKVVSKKVNPEDILTDFTEMPSNLANRLGVIADEEEVLVYNRAKTD